LDGGLSFGEGGDGVADEGGDRGQQGGQERRGQRLEHLCDRLLGVSGGDRTGYGRSWDDLFSHVLDRSDGVGEPGSGLLCSSESGTP
jgi:hypothetical protein